MKRRARLVRRIFRQAHPQTRLARRLLEANMAFAFIWFKMVRLIWYAGASRARKIQNYRRDEISSDRSE
jgi:hypothetical protein